MCQILGSWKGAARVALLLSWTSSLVLVLGCSDDGLGSRYSVTGTVTHKGQPVESGQITFTPAEPGGRAATGPIQKGRYTLSTNGTNDGALPGNYKVGISSRVIDLSKFEKNTEKTGGLARQDDVVKAYKEASKGAIPAKFEIGETSGLTAKVEAKSNTFDFNIPD